MATRNKRKLAALNKENCEEHPKSNLALNSNVPRSQEDYITLVSEEIEGRVTKICDSQSNPHPEAGLFISGREDRHDMAMEVQRECTQAHDICFNLVKKIHGQKRERTTFLV